MVLKITHRGVIYIIIGAIIAWFITGGTGSTVPLYLLFALLVFGFVWYYKFLNDKQ